MRRLERKGLRKKLDDLCKAELTLHRSPNEKTNKARADAYRRAIEYVDQLLFRRRYNDET